MRQVIARQGRSAPRLSDNILIIYMEATPHETETRLHAGLKKHCPELPENLGLRDSLAALRRGKVLPAARSCSLSWTSSSSGCTPAARTRTPY